MLVIAFGLIDEEPLNLEILRLKQQNCLTRQAITTSPTGFLIIRFDIFGNLGVNDKPHVAFINTHAERIRCNHNWFAIKQKIFLISSTLRFTHARVIFGHRQLLMCQKGIQTVNFFSGAGIDDACLIDIQFQVI